jgi:hypothetical protein
MPNVTASGLFTPEVISQLIHTFTESIKVITKLPNSEQPYKGKVKTHFRGTHISFATLKIIFTFFIYFFFFSKLNKYPHLQNQKTIIVQYLALEPLTYEELTIQDMYWYIKKVIDE